MTPLSKLPLSTPPHGSFVQKFDDPTSPRPIRAPHNSERELCEPGDTILCTYGLATILAVRHGCFFLAYRPSTIEVHRVPFWINVPGGGSGTSDADIHSAARDFRRYTDKYFLSWSERFRNPTRTSPSYIIDNCHYTHSSDPGSFRGFGGQPFYLIPLHQTTPEPVVLYTTNLWSQDYIPASIRSTFNIESTHRFATPAELSVVSRAPFLNLLKSGETVPLSLWQRHMS